MTVTDFLFSWLVRSALLGLLILFVGSGAVLAFRQPVRRLRIIELVLCASLLAPFLGMVPGYPRLSVVAWRSVEPKPQENPLPHAIGPITGPTAPGPTSFPAPDGGSRPTLGDNSADLPAPARDARPWLVAAYLVGVAVAIGWWLVGLAGLVRVLRTASPAPPRCHELLAEISAGRGDRVRLLASCRLKQPFATVWGRATIVLPEDLCGDENALRWCLAHEWSHIARHDFRAWLLAGLARALFFYQPLVWWLRRQLRLCQDFLADAQAAGQASQVEDYAEFLTGLAAKGKWQPAALGLSMRSGKSELYRRVIMLLKNQPLEDRAGRFWTISATAAAVVLAAITAAISFAPKAVAEEKPALNQAAAKGSGAAPASDSGASVQLGFTLSEGDGFISLPAYQQLNSADMRRHYHFTADQEKKLLSIAQDFQRELKKIADKESRKGSPQQPSAEYLRLQREEVAACRRQVENTLTKEQVAAYKHDIMALVAGYLGDPRLHDERQIGLSPQQGEQLERLADEMRRAAEENGLKQSRQVLAILNEEQRRTLSASLPGDDLATGGIVVPARNYEGAGANLIDDTNSLLFRADDSRGARIWVCPTLTENAVRKQLGLSGPQQERVLAIAKKFQADAQQAFKIYPATNAALDKLSKEEQKAKRAECERKLKDIGSDTIRQVEAVLGPQPWAALKTKLQEVKETAAASQLMWPSHPILRKLNLTPQQRTKLRELVETLQASGSPVPLETGEKALAVLTADQRKKLEERLDQQGW